MGFDPTVCRLEGNRVSNYATKTLQVTNTAALNRYQRMDFLRTAFILSNNILPTCFSPSEV